MMGMDARDDALVNLSPPQGCGEGNARVPSKRLFVLALLACAVAATLGAQPLAAWTDASIAAGTSLQDAAKFWLSLTQSVGFDRPYTALRHTVRDLEAARFPDRD